MSVWKSPTYTGLILIHRNTIARIQITSAQNRCSIGVGLGTSGVVRPTTSLRDSTRGANRVTARKNCLIGRSKTGSLWRVGFNESWNWRRRFRVLEKRLDEWKANVSQALMSEQKRALRRRQVGIPRIKNILRDTRGRRRCNRLVRDRFGIRWRIDEIDGTDGMFGTKEEKT